MDKTRRLRIYRAKIKFIFVKIYIIIINHLIYKITINFKLIRIITAITVLYSRCISYYIFYRIVKYYKEHLLRNDNDWYKTLTTQILHSIQYMYNDNRLLSNGDTSKFYFRPAACLNNKTLNSLATSAFDGRRPILTLNFYDYILDKIIPR